MAKLFGFSAKHRVTSHVLKGVVLLMICLQSSCELIDLDAKPSNYPDKVYYNFVLEVREFGTEQPISGLFVTGYYREVSKVTPVEITQFSGTTNDSGLYQVKKWYYQISSIRISGSKHLSGNIAFTNGQRNILYLKQATKLGLRFDFASLASKEPNGLFDKVKFTIGKESGEVSSSTTTGWMMLEGNQEVVVELAGYKNGQLVKSWQNWVYLPGKQDIVHTVTMDHDQVAD